MTKKHLKTQQSFMPRRTVLSLLISTLCFATAPTWAADCLSEANANGGFNITCSGTDNEFKQGSVSGTNNNVVTIQGEDTSVTNYVYGGYSNGSNNNGVDIKENTIILNDNSYVSGAWGGYALASDNIEKNTVTLNNNSSTSSVGGGFGFNAKTITDNTVTLNANSTAYIVYGGYSQGTGSVEGNTVNLNDNSQASIIYASYVYSSTTATSKNNTVNINGNITSTSTVSGASGNFNPEMVSGNTLNFNNNPSSIATSKLSTSELSNFDAYNVYLSGDISNYFTNNFTEGLITVTGLFGNSYASKATFTVKNNHITLTEANNLKVGDKFIILDTAFASYAQGSKLSDNINLVNEGINAVSIGLIYTLDVELGINDDEGSIYVLIDEGNDENGGSGENGGNGENGGSSSGNGNSIKPILKVDKNAIDRLSPVLDSQVATMTVLNQGNTLSNRVLIGIEPTQKGEVITFGQMTSGHIKTKGTSDININGLNLLVGAGYNVSDKTIIGGYFEYGYGHYNSTRNFSGYSNGTTNFSALHYNGSGNVNYEGVGVIGKHYFAGFNDALYIDGGLKVGSSSTNYSSTSFTDAHYRSSNMDFNNSQIYFGGSVGTGYLWKIENNKTLNSSLNFIYSQFKGDDITIDSTLISMDKMKSERLRLEETYLQQLNDLTAINLSAAFDYELNDKATGTVESYEMTTSTIKGGTGSISAGVRFTPFNHADKDKYIEVNVYGTQGKVDSVGGNISFNYNF